MSGGSVRKAEYCWQVDDGEEIHGPFSTIEAAEADAREEADYGGHVLVAKVAYVDPAAWVGYLTAQDVAEGMDEHLCENIAFEDQVFEVRDPDAADKALEAALAAWAAEHIDAGGMWSMGETVKEFDIEASPDGIPVQRCRVCGCTDQDCRQCIEKTGSPCHWVESDLCSACVTQELTHG